MLHFAQVLLNKELRQGEFLNQILHFAVHANCVLVQEGLNVLPVREFILQVLEGYFGTVLILNL